MRLSYQNSAAKIFVLPVIRDQFKYNLTKQELFERLHKLKSSHNDLISFILIDDINGKFWIVCGSFSATTFKGIISSKGKNNIISGSFKKNDIWLSYFLTIFAGLSWVYFLISQKNSAEMFLCLLMSSTIHLFNSIKFYMHIKYTVKFMVSELAIYSAQSDDFLQNC